MATFLFDKIIFGPVKSRRLGISLGINLLPTQSKLCNFNCVYCECGWTPNKENRMVQFHERRLVALKLEEKLLEMSRNNTPPDVITYAGNGEPTMHPEFESIIDDTIRIKNKYFPKARIAVLSNATLLHKSSVVRALNRIDDNILKLDSAIEETTQLINVPLGKHNINRLTEQLKSFNGNLIIQTMFLRGEYKGKKIDNSTDKEISALIRAFHKIKPKQIMIYTIARDTPLSSLKKLSLNELNLIRKQLEKEGFTVQVSG